MALGGYTQVGTGMLSQSSLSQRPGASFSLGEDGDEEDESGQRRPLGPSRRRGRRGGGRRGGFGTGSTQLSRLSQLQSGGLQEGAGEGDKGERAISQDLVGFDEEEEDTAAGASAFGETAASGAAFFGAEWAGLRRLHGLNRELCMPAFMAALRFLAEKVRWSVVMKVHRRFHFRFMCLFHFPQRHTMQAQPPAPSSSSASASASRPPPPAPAKPAWLAALEQALTEAGLHANARLFLLQALLNEPTASLLRPWAAAPGSHLGSGVLRVVRELLLIPPSANIFGGGGRGGLGGCHYLLCDVADLFVTAWAGYRPTARGALRLCLCRCVCKAFELGQPP